MMAPRGDLSMKESTLTEVRNEVRFILNDREERLSEVRSSDTLLDHLRLARRLRGTKEGCAEGDCGACTVLVGRRAKGGLVYEPVNACIRLLASVDLCHVVTVEHLAKGGELHPVQKAMVDLHGSQCGFCTPGIVMSLYGLWMRKPDASEAEIETALQGNLCRCTGYSRFSRRRGRRRLPRRRAIPSSPSGRRSWRDSARSTTGGGSNFRVRQDRVILPGFGQKPPGGALRRSKNPKIVLRLHGNLGFGNPNSWRNLAPGVLPAPFRENAGI